MQWAELPDSGEGRGKRVIKTGCELSSFSGWCSSETSGTVLSSDSGGLIDFFNLGSFSKILSHKEVGTFA